MSEERTTVERLARIETMVEYIKDGLTHHVKWEENKYAEMGNKFASKEYEQLFSILDNKVQKMPDALGTRFAGIWVESWVKATIFTVLGSIFVAVILKFV